MPNILDLVSKKNTKRGTLTVLYGIGGIGKTTIGAQLAKEKNGVVIQLEEGLSKLGLSDVPRINVMEINKLNKARDKNYEDKPVWVNFLTTLADLSDKEASPFKSVVIDTIDAIIPDLETYVVNKYYKGNQKAADDYYTKYNEYAKEFNRVIKAFNRMMDNGVDVYVLGHSVIVTHKDPNNDPFQRWMINLPGGAKTSLADMLYNTADNFIFLGRDVTVIDGATRGSQSVAHTEWNPSYEAKHRSPMPESILLNINDNFTELKKYI